MSAGYALAGGVMPQTSFQTIELPKMPHELSVRLRQRLPHALLLGFAVGAMEELRLLPQTPDGASLIAVLGLGWLAFFNSTVTSLILVGSITAVERTRLAQAHRTLALSATVVIASLVASASGVCMTILRYSEGGLTITAINSGSASMPGAIEVPEFAGLQGLFFHLLWFALAIGFLAASYFTVSERARLSSVRVRAAELERQGIEQQVVESRLNVMKARVEPEFLFRSIGEIQNLYRTNIEAAENRLEDLIAYLRAALPQMRGGASTLGDELYLASTYLRLHDDGFEGRLKWSLEIDDELRASHFPPMALLPLVDDALRRGAALEQPELTLAVRASLHGARLLVEIEDDCANIRQAGDGDLGLLAQERAFVEFFGGSATVSREAASGSGTRILLEADHDVAARGNR